MRESEELFGRGFQILQDRQRWEQKQRLYYQMRHDGIRRRNKPFPTAADLHLALIDEAITKLKPFWLAQALGSDRLAAFVAMRQQLETVTSSAADFLDFELKQRTEYVRKLESAVDTMLLRGRGILKPYVDPFDEYKIVFENVDPLFIIMPDSANDFEDTDEFIHVRQVTVARFKRDRRYRDVAEDAKVVGMIRGIRDEQKFREMIQRVRGNRDKNFETIFADKELREGITHSRSDDAIVIWEHYIRTTGGWTVYEYCPQATEIELRKPHGVPYKVGGKVSLPFKSFVAEVKDEGWYSPRGVAEKIAAHELYACKVWNEKADAITFFNRPLVTSDTPIANPANYRWQPGEYVPGNLKAVQMGQPAMSFDQEIYFARGEAEQAVQSPDFGIQRQDPRQGSKPRTATENQRISALQQAGANHNGGIFRTDLCKLYRHCWGLILQYKRPSLTYFIANDLQTLPEQALHDEYLIMPDGSPDQWDRDKRFQDAMGLLQTFKGAPNIDQDGLVKNVLTARDARLVQRLFVPSNTKAGTEAEDEAMEIVIMTDGFPAQVKPGEDHLTRVKVLLGWLQKQGATRQPVDPLAQKRIHEHLAVHMQYLKQLQPQAYRQLLQGIKQQSSGPTPGSAPMPPGGQGLPPSGGVPPIGGA